MCSNHDPGAQSAPWAPFRKPCGHRLGRSNHEIALRLAKLRSVSAAWLFPGTHHGYGRPHTILVSWLSSLTSNTILVGAIFSMKLVYIPRFPRVKFPRPTMILNVKPEALKARLKEKTVELEAVRDFLMPRAAATSARWRHPPIPG